MGNRGPEPNWDDVLTTLPNSTEEDRARATFAIPRVIGALSLGDLAIENWRQTIADQIHHDWRKRAHLDENVPFSDLSPEDRKPFLDVVEAVITVRKKAERS